MKSTTKSRPSPRSAKPAASKPAKTGHTAPAQGPKASKPGKAPPAPAKAKRPPTRGEQTVAMLRRAKGVSLDEMVKAFGVQKHTARALVSVFGRQAGGVERREGRYHLKG